jgi:hypothetical protein
MALRQVEVAKRRGHEGLFRIRRASRSAARDLELGHPLGQASELGVGRSQPTISLEILARRLGIFPLQRDIHAQARCGQLQRVALEGGDQLVLRFAESALRDQDPGPRHLRRNVIGPRSEPLLEQS